MGYYSELDITLRNRAQFGEDIDVGDLEAIAALLQGEVDGRFVRCASPGLPPDDRSCFIRIDPSRPSDFFIYDCEGSHAAAKANVRKKLKMVEAAPRKDYSDMVARIWNEALPSAGTLVERYLRSVVSAILAAHYLPRDPEVGRNAIDKLNAYRATKSEQNLPTAPPTTPKLVGSKTEKA